MPFSSNSTVRANWTKSVVEMVETTGIDGITFDYESPIPQGDPKMEQYIQIINETNIALKKVNPGY
jgi:GH18 family chitinase